MLLTVRHQQAKFSSAFFLRMFFSYIQCKSCMKKELREMRKLQKSLHSCNENTLMWSYYVSSNSLAVQKTCQRKPRGTPGQSKLGTNRIKSTLIATMFFHLNFSDFPLASPSPITFLPYILQDHHPPLPTPPPPNTHTHKCIHTHTLIVIHTHNHGWHKVLLKFYIFFQMQAFSQFFLFLFFWGWEGSESPPPPPPCSSPHSHTPLHNPPPPLPTNLFPSSAHTYSHNLNITLNFNLLKTSPEYILGLGSMGNACYSTITWSSLG